MPEPFHIYLYGVGRGPIPASFERLAEQLSVVERMYFEMDGSFVWTGEQEHVRWQLDGMIYDAAGAIQYVDIKGWCPWINWNSFLTTLAGEKPWSEDWVVMRLPTQTEQALREFNHNVWYETLAGQQ